MHCFSSAVRHHWHYDVVDKQGMVLLADAWRYRQQRIDLRCCVEWAYCTLAKINDRSTFKLYFIESYLKVLKVYEFHAIIVFVDSKYIGSTQQVI